MAPPEKPPLKKTARPAKSRTSQTEKQQSEKVCGSEDKPDTAKPSPNAKADSPVQKKTSTKGVLGSRGAKSPAKGIKPLDTPGTSPKVVKAEGVKASNSSAKVVETLEGPIKELKAGKCNSKVVNTSESTHKVVNTSGATSKGAAKVNNSTKSSETLKSQPITKKVIKSTRGTLTKKTPETSKKTSQPPRKTTTEKTENSTSPSALVEVNSPTEDIENTGTSTSLPTLQPSSGGCEESSTAEEVAERHPNDIEVKEVAERHPKDIEVKEVAERHLNDIEVKEVAGSETIEDARQLSMADAKLANLCKLLESIVVQHSGVECVPKIAVQQKAAAEVHQKSDAAPSVTICPPPAEDTMPNEADANTEKTREEVEEERKARKAAKKSKKKGSGNTDETCKVEAEKPAQVPKETQNPNKATEGKAVPLQQSNQGKSPQKADVEEGKSKADLKRERREKQEAQRQAKEAQKAQQEAERQKKNQPQSQTQAEAAKTLLAKKKGGEAKRGRDKKSVDKDDHARRIPLLGHLIPHSPTSPVQPVNCDTIHPAIRTIAIKMKERVIDGSTARVIATLAAMKRFIGDYRTPESCDLSRDLAGKLVPNVQYLNACRPLAVAMENSVRFLKHKINSIEPSMPEAQAKDLLLSAIDDYVCENINLASSTIASHAAQLLIEGDVILTFGYSALLCDMVEVVRSSGVNVSVVVADSPYPASGAAMVKRLAASGVTTYYRLITDITQIMPKVTKVVVEAEAVMMNGAVQSVCGTASLALAAAMHDTPFIVLCHTYKFNNNDLTDSLVVNELGNADCIVSCPSTHYQNLLSGWEATENLNVVRLVYDVTPASLVTVLVTEQSVLPTSAVPVIIRRNYADVLGQD